VDALQDGAAGQHRPAGRDIPSPGFVGLRPCLALPRDERADERHGAEAAAAVRPGPLPDAAGGRSPSGQGTDHSPDVLHPPRRALRVDRVGRGQGCAGFRADPRRWVHPGHPLGRRAVPSPRCRGPRRRGRARLHRPPLRPGRRRPVASPSLRETPTASGPRRHGPRGACAVAPPGPALFAAGRRSLRFPADLPEWKDFAPYQAASAGRSSRAACCEVPRSPWPAGRRGGRRRYRPGPRAAARCRTACSWSPGHCRRSSCRRRVCRPASRCVTGG
jgi:hypothetical protein